MKKYFSLLIALLLINAGVCVQAQTVDKILNSYFENTGGKAKWNKLNSMIMEGKVEAQGQQFPVKMYNQRPNFQRMEMVFQGKTIVQRAYDGKDAWASNPIAGKTVKLPEEQAKELAEDMFEPAYLNYKTKGHKIVLDGKEEIEGTECNKLKLTKKNGDVEYLFFDTESNVLLMQRTTVKQGPSKGTQIDSFMSDYKEVGGLMIPHALTQKMGTNTFTVTMDKITLNSKIDKSLFSFPKKK
ncbi:LolA-like protein [Microscilla marina]|uniref:Hypothetical signal peptide protein n=1 Tax=Microscilla marina ATCC 23134 TaxID=313606 RepID=A1ZF52_MICM2|nr:hypothetical protein [Microscilla marina]EAY31154.1 hypothetical signal peptide protein [Microscilla marina ATCC 23134]